MVSRCQAGKSAAEILRVQKKKSYLVATASARPRSTARITAGTTGAGAGTAGPPSSSGGAESSLDRVRCARVRAHMSWGGDKREGGAVQRHPSDRDWQPILRGDRGHTLGYDNNRDTSNDPVWVPLPTWT